MFVRVVLIVAFLSLGSIGIPRDEAKDISGQTAAQPPSKPDSPMGRLLRALEGTWSITDQLMPDAASPKGKTGAGTIIWRPGPGGFSAVEEFRSQQGDVEVTGLGELWWEDAVHGYHTIWCDSTNPGGCIDFKNAAHWEGSTLVLQEDYEVNGKKFTFREVFGDITQDSFTQTLYGGEAGGSLKVDEIIHGRKRKAS
jgi:hypothetical protein